MDWSANVCSSDLLDDGAGVILDGNGNQAFGGHTARLLRRGRQALLAQPVDRRIDVAVGLAQRLLAIHHARAGLLAQILYQGRSDLSHVRVLSVLFRSEEHTSELQSLMRISY